MGDLIDESRFKKLELGQKHNFLNNVWLGCCVFVTCDAGRTPLIKFYFFYFLWLTFFWSWCEVAYMINVHGVIYVQSLPKYYLLLKNCGIRILIFKYRFVTRFLFFCTDIFFCGNLIFHFLGIPGYRRTVT